MTTAKELHTIGENLRAEQPVLWGILRGRGSDFRIALLLGWTEKMVYEELVELSRRGIAAQNTQGTWYLKSGYKDHDLYVQLRKLYQAIDSRIAENHSGKVELSELSPKVRGEARKREAEEKAKVPSETQWKMLLVIWKAFGTDTFTPLDLAKAQGFTKAGWSKSYIETLGRKGYVQQMAMRGRSTTWQLTELGVEWAKK